MPTSVDNKQESASSADTDYLKKLEAKVRQQLTSQKVGYLLGSGVSHLAGQGYPLTNDLWNLIREDMPATERTDIQSKLDSGANGLEKALDLIDDGGVIEQPHRHSLTAAIAKHFSRLAPPLEVHKNFLTRLSKRPDRSVPLFCLNYDPLFERAAEQAKIRLFDGFIGSEAPYFDPIVFQQDIAVIQRAHHPTMPSWSNGVIHLFKLHGSVGWYEHPTEGIRRNGAFGEVPSGSRRLMVPPQRRKATDTMALPYASLWSEFRGLVRHGPKLINRLVCIGYGMRDEHVNAVIENGLARQSFTLLIHAKILEDSVFDRWKVKANVILVTEERSSLYGQVGPGHPELWDFQKISKEV